MRHKKHLFHCEKCGIECTIYKKGKHHRVLICPQCGILATNGKAQLLAKVAKRGLKAIPLLGTALEIGGIAKDIYDETRPPKLDGHEPHYHHVRHPTLSEQIVMREVYPRRYHHG